MFVLLLTTQTPARFCKKTYLLTIEKIPRTIRHKSLTRTTESRLVQKSLSRLDVLTITHRNQCVICADIAPKSGKPEYRQLVTCHKMVPMAGVEPARLTPLPPQDSVSTNSTTSAMFFYASQLYECHSDTITAHNQI